MRDEGNGTKAAIGDAALMLFAQRGYAAVSVRDIADQVGIRQSAIYNHFPGKQAILVHLMEGHLRTLLEAYKAQANPQGHPAERLRAFVAFHVHYHIDHPADVFIAYMELRSLEPDNRKAIVPLRRAYEAELKRILAEGAERGVFVIEDLSIATMNLIAMMTGVTNWWRPNGRLTKDEIAGIYTRMVEGAVRAAPDAADQQEETVEDLCSIAR